MPTRPPAIGVMLPSSNRIVERVAQAIRQAHPGLDICLTRVPYGGHPPDGYTLGRFREAALLLAEAQPDFILWNATRGALLGFEPDRALCAMIEDATGIPATTTALATLRTLQARQVRRLGMIVQGSAADCERLRSTFGKEGVEVVATVPLGITDNLNAAIVGADAFTAAAQDLRTRADPDAVLIWSTNLAGHALSRQGGAERGPILDSATIGFDDVLGRLENGVHAGG